MKADIGIRDGRIVGVGKAGNPDVMGGVHPDLRPAPTPPCVPGDSFIVTAGAIEGHAHFLSPQQSTTRSRRRHHHDRMTPGPVFEKSAAGPTTFARLYAGTDHIA